MFPQKTLSRVATVKEKETKPMIVLVNERGDIVESVDKVTPMFDKNKTEVE
jgi:hypothetical protein